MKRGSGKRDEAVCNGGAKRRGTDTIGGTHNEVEVGVIAKWTNSNNDVSGRDMQETRWEHYLRLYEDTGVGRKDTGENDCCKTGRMEQ